jgi:hypothetical protein
MARRLLFVAGLFAGSGCDETGSFTIVGESVAPGESEVAPDSEPDSEVDSDATPDTEAPADNDGDGVFAPLDCDDGDPDVAPGQEERCNGVDDDCARGADDGNVCPCPSRTHAGAFYLLCVNQRTWDNARGVCQDFGLDLVVINGLDESVYVREEARLVGGESWWLGFSDLAQEGQWAWVDASADGFLRWTQGEPNNFNEEDCAELQTSTGRWNDIACGLRRPFVCELPATPLP